MRRESRPIDSDLEAFDELTGDRRDQIEILVDMQHGESGDLCGRGDEQVGYGWSAVLAAVGEQQLDLDSAICRTSG
jgi:hypothetical protein